MKTFSQVNQEIDDLEKEIKALEKEYHAKYNAIRRKADALRKYLIEKYITDNAHTSQEKR